MTDKKLIQKLKEDVKHTYFESEDIPETLEPNLRTAINRLEALLSENERLKEQIHKDTAEKHAYLVGTLAEGASDGYVYLTEREASIVYYATNKANWVDAHDDGYSGEFFIDTEQHPINHCEW